MDDTIKLASGLEVPRMPMEQCKHCSRYFRFDMVAKHETTCLMGRGVLGRAKFDAIGHHLRGTPSAKYIGQIREERARGFEPWRERKKKKNPNALHECDRCGRSFHSEAIAKHRKHCKGQNPRRNFAAKTVSPKGRNVSFIFIGMHAN
jgi:hypothetical protein